MKKIKQLSQTNCEVVLNKKNTYLKPKFFLPNKLIKFFIVLEHVKLHA